MKNSRHIGILSVLSLLSLSLCYIGFFASPAYDGLFFAAPSAPVSESAAGIPIKTIEEQNGDPLLLTYEIFRHSTTKALNANHSVTLIGTNYAYPHVMDIPVSSGSFFTKSAQEQQSRAATMNQTAAFTIFGSIQIVGEIITLDRDSYIITGVIDDGSQDLNIYLPASFLGASVDLLLALTNVSDMETRDSLQISGVDDTSYTIVNLQACGKTLYEKWLATLILAAAALLFLVLRQALRVCMQNFCQIRALSDDFYIRQMVLSRPDVFFRAALTCLVVLLSSSLLLMSSARLLAMMLSWEKSADIPEYITSLHFAGRISELQQVSLYADFLFTAFTAALVLFFIVNLVFVNRKLRRSLWQSSSSRPR